MVGCRRVQLLVAMVTLLSWVTEARDLRVGAFNIQVFGTSKASKPDVMQILVKIIRRYDVLLIQEIRDRSGEAIVSLLEQVNAGLSADLQFSMLLSERLGRTISMEQYAYFYRPGQGLTVSGVYTYDDVIKRSISTNATKDLFEREPYIVAFHSSKTVLSMFTLVGIHVDPDVAVDEINSLYDVTFDAKDRLRNGDVMIMGDLNADCSYVSSSKWSGISLKTDPAFTWWIGNEADTTVKHTHCAYDRFVSCGAGWSSGIVPGSAVVYEFDSDPALGNISRDLAEDVSDHYPIEFLLKHQRYAVYMIPDVYVVLADPDVSLLQSYLYNLDSSLTVTDDNKNVAGRLRHDTETSKLLTVAVQAVFAEMSLLSETVLMKLDPVRNRWGGRQNCVLAIEVGANMNSQEAVEAILYSVRIKYEKQYL